MKRYEAMFIVRPDLSEEEKKALFKQINDTVVKNDGAVSSADIWSEKRKLYFPLKRYQDGVYYLMDLRIMPEAVTKLRLSFALNDNILRVLITSLE